MGEISNQKSKKNFWIITILIILVIGLVGYIAYDKILSKSDINNDIKEQKQQETNNNDDDEQNFKKYNVNDYISVTDYEFNENCLNCGTYGTVKRVEFKTLPLRTTTEFDLKHNEFIHPTAFETAKLSNEISYEVDKNILSIYTNESKSYEQITQYNYYSLNVNLNKK